jgi:hypothetical protein
VGLAFPVMVAIANDVITGDEHPEFWAWPQRGKSNLTREFNQP